MTEESPVLHFMNVSMTEARKSPDFDEGNFIRQKVSDFCKEAGIDNDEWDVRLEPMKNKDDFRLTARLRRKLHRE